MTLLCYIVAIAPSPVAITKVKASLVVRAMPRNRPGIIFALGNCTFDSK